MARPLNPDAHWRDSARLVRFFFFDYRAVFALLFFLFNAHVWSFMVSLAAICFFAMLERYGFTVVVFLRYLRSSLAGRRKMSHPWWRESRFR